MKKLIKRWLKELMIEIFQEGEMPCTIIAHDFKANGRRKECAVCGETDLRICNKCFYRNR